MPKPKYRRVAVVGVGLIGGSAALALRDRGLAEEVIGVVRSPERVAPTIACGVVDDATDSIEEGCRGADCVLIATPVDRIAAAACHAARCAAPGALVTDGGSTKLGIVEQVQRDWPSGPDRPAFVGAHPLAGDHRTGPAAARADLFEGATVVLTPTDGTRPDAVVAANAFWAAIGATTVVMSPGEHDELVAQTSHVPHIAAAALAAITPVEAAPLTATGWRDTTRVAAGSPTLWREILLANPAPIAAGLRRLASELETYVAALESGDGATLERLLEAGRQRRAAGGEGKDALGS